MASVGVLPGRGLKRLQGTSHGAPVGVGRRQEKNAEESAR